MSIVTQIVKVCAALVCLCPASGSAADLRYDGIYRCQEPSKDLSIYVRFYSDGTVLFVASTGTPQEIVEWFHRDGKGGSSGRFTRQQDKIRFTAFGFESRTDCVGTIEDASIVLQCGGNDLAFRCEFVPMRLAQ